MKTMSQKTKDRLINALYHRHCSGIQIDIMDIGKVFKEGERLLASGLTDEDAGNGLRAFTLSIAKN